MRLWPQSLAGRLAGLLVLTLVVAQIVTFALFAGERIAAFGHAYREDLSGRLVSLVRLLEETPPDLHGRIVATMNSTLLRVALEPEPRLPASRTESAPAVALAAELQKAPADVRIAAARPRWGHDEAEREENEDDAERDEDEDHEMHGHHPRWVRVSIRLKDGSWLNAAAGRPPIPPLGIAFMASFLISAAAVAAVGALGVRWASQPLHKLADAADRLGRGEAFEPLPETGPRETRQANIAFNRMRERLDRYVRDRTAMLAAVAHDLRTPITAMRLRAEFIEDEETRSKILETLGEMQAMAEAVLAFARGDAETEPSRTTDLSALVESLVEDAAEGGRDVRFGASAAAVLTCRPFALRRAIGNLLDNATSHGIRAQARVEADAHEARIIIEDEGPGIPVADLDRVFDPFVRLEASRSRETGGAGLGLAITRSIIRAHGGDISLENRPGGGLRATATLPGKSVRLAAGRLR